MYKNVKKTYKSKKWSAKRSYCLAKCSVDQPAEDFPAVSEKSNKFILFSETFDFYFSSLRSYGREECSDYNVAGGF